MDFSNMLSILVVDDSQSFAEVMISNLKELGFNKTSYVLTPKEALETISNQPIDILFVDIVMPEVNGIELIKLIREKIKNIKIIAMSSLAQEKVIIESISAGADDFIQKPVPTHILESIMDKVIDATEGNDD